MDQIRRVSVLHLSIERLISALDAEKVDLQFEKKIDCYLVSLGEKAKEYSVPLLQELRRAGFSSERDYQDRKLKAQFKSAERLGAKFAVIIGEDELNKGAAAVKNLENGEEKELSLQNFIEEFEKLSR